MRKVPPLLQRELSAYFYSPIAYVVLVVLLAGTGFFFNAVIEWTREASIRHLLGYMQFIILLLTPLISMRLFSEEYRQGTIETLMTDPVSDWEVVLGKFLGAWTFYLFLLIPTFGFVFLLKQLGDPEMGPIWSGYIGLALMGTMFMAIGMFFSATTKNQIIAAILTIVSLLTLQLIGFATKLTDRWYASVCKYLSLQEHMESFEKGIIDSRDLVYYLSFAALFIFLTVRLVEGRKWK